MAKKPVGGRTRRPADGKTGATSLELETAVTPKGEQNRRYYEVAWKQVAEQLSHELETAGFSPKGKNGRFEIGNKHGQVYAYPSANRKLHDALHQLFITPTPTGMLSIKLTFKSEEALSKICRRIDTAISPIELGAPKVEKDRIIAEFQFYAGPRPEEATEASSALLERAVTWLSTISAEDDW